MGVAAMPSSTVISPAIARNGAAEFPMAEASRNPQAMTKGQDGEQCGPAPPRR